MSESQKKDVAAFSATMILLVLVVLLLLIGWQQFVLIVLPALSVAFAGFCIWLTVRIINRRERWAKCTAAALVIILVVGYPLSFLVVAAISFYMQASPSGTARELLLGIDWPLIWIGKEYRFFNRLFEWMLTPIGLIGLAMASAGVLAAGIFAVREATRYLSRRSVS